MFKKFLMGALLALFVSPAFAQGAVLKVGDPVADFTARHWINQPTFESFNELKGEVIVLKAWGID